MTLNSFLRLLLVVCFCLFSSLLLAKHASITIDNNRHMLVAPVGGQSYQWYKDGFKLAGKNDSLLLISEAGNYKVELVNAEGLAEAGNVSVLLNAAGTIIKIYTIGDSTVQDYTAGYYPRKGWGQVLGGFFTTDNVQVINKAVGGTSSKSFYNSYWPAVVKLLGAGDFVFIQFGINDAKHNPPDPTRDAATGGEFEGYLQKYVEEARAKGAIPVLVTTVRRNSWNADGVTVYDAYHTYPIATRTVAKSLNVPLVDLDAKLKVAMEAAGKTYTTRFWHNNYVAGEYPNYPNGNNDDVHFQEMGAINNASLVVKSIQELNADPNVGKLVPFIKPQFETTIHVNPVGSDDATTRTASYPQGLTITLKTLPKTGKTFQKWNNVAGTSIATKTLTTVTSGSAATAYTAMYAGATNCAATATAAGPTSICQGQSVVLSVSSGASYSWKNGSTVVGTGATYMAAEAGSYTADVTTAAGCTATSLPIVVSMIPSSNCGVTAVAESTGAADHFSCFPNPFTTGIYLGAKSNFTYVIYTMDGSEAEKGSGENSILAGKTLNPGLYMVRLEASGETRYFKVHKE